MQYFLYVSILFFIMFLLLQGLTRAFRYAPIKIKIMSTILYPTLMIRNIVLLMLFLSSNMVYLHLLKPFYNLHLVMIPFAAVSAIFILWRNDKLRYSKVYILFIGTILAYVLLLLINPLNIQLHSGNSYKMVFQQPLIPNLYYLFINLFFLLVGIQMRIEKGRVQTGSFIVITAAVVGLLDIGISVIGYKLFPDNLLGELMWIITFNYALNSFKRIPMRSK